jgi:hypothetical protein
MKATSLMEIDFAMLNPPVVIERRKRKISHLKVNRWI